MIDRAEDGDGDAVRPAPNRPVGAERAGSSPADSPVADSPATADAPADEVRTDAALTSAEQRAAAHRRYQDVVDHTYDVARIDAGQDAETGSQQAQPWDEGEEGTTRDAGETEGETALDADPDADAPDGELGEQDAEGIGAGAPEDEAPDAKDGAARPTWAEALPQLRAVWEKYEERYPERSRVAPRTHPDGTWEAGDRKLTPEQNADACKACEDIRAEGREVVLPAMRRVEAADPERRLAGLEHMLKGEDRLKEKIADEMTAKPEVTISEAVDAVVDPVRFTFTYSSQRYAEGTLSDVERVESEGFELVKLKNLWTDDQYKGINSQWRRPETGLRFEIQFHTPESLEAKELTHRAYERIRSTASPAERQEAKAYQRQVNELLATPPGTAEIKDFPEKR